MKKKNEERVGFEPLPFIQRFHNLLVPNASKWLGQLLMDNLAPNSCLAGKSNF